MAWGFTDEDDSGFNAATGVRPVGWKEYAYSDAERAAQGGKTHKWANHNDIVKHPDAGYFSAEGVAWPYMDNATGYKNWWKTPANINPVFKQNYGYNPKTQQFPKIDNPKFGHPDFPDEKPYLDAPYKMSGGEAQYSDAYAKYKPFPAEAKWVDTIDKAGAGMVPSVDQSEQMTMLMNQNSAFSEDAEANAMLEAAMMYNSPYNQYQE